MSKNTRYKVIAAVCTLVIQLLLFVAFNFNFMGLLSMIPKEEQQEEADIPFDKIMEDLSQLMPINAEPDQESIKPDEAAQAPEQPSVKENPVSQNDKTTETEPEPEREQIAPLQQDLKKLLPPPEEKKLAENKDTATNQPQLPDEIIKLLEENPLSKRVAKDTQDKRTQAEKIQFFKNNYKAIRNFLKVYPYAVRTREIIDSLNTELAKTKSKAEQKRMINDTEKMLFGTYEQAVRRMNAAQGKILLKMIARETNKTGYQLIKDFKGGFSATFWYALGKMFSTDLKTQYNKQGEDSIYEEILERYEGGEFK